MGEAKAGVVNRRHFPIKAFRSFCTISVLLLNADGACYVPSLPFNDIVPWLMNKRLSFFSFALISSQTSSTFLRMVRSFLMKVNWPSG